METNTDLKVVLEKFRQGNATPDELQLLYGMLNKPDKTEIDKLMAEEWAEVSDANGEIDSLSLLESIRNKAGIIAEDETQDIESEKKWQFNIATFMRYAAVFICAIGLTWFLKPSSGNDSTSSKPQFFTIKVAYGSKSTIELPDSSVVVLNSGSTLSYPDKFETASRTVMLTGEAFFEVKKNSKRPFYVKTQDVTIRVLGTKFNVKSYPDENTSETTLVSGSVEIMKNNSVQIEEGKKNITEHIFLKPNQKAIFTRTTGQTELKEVTKEQPKERVKTEPITPVQLIAKIADQDQKETDIDIAWKNNKLILNNDRFGDIIKILERWYNVDITLLNPALADVRFSAKFDRESIADVLNALNIIEPFHYEINKNIVVILKK
jgi:ferric-dicitrate binding protein FerR (iron transport regulator)